MKCQKELWIARLVQGAVTTALTILVAGCGGDDSGGGAATASQQSPGSASNTSSSLSANDPPSLSGNPGRAANADMTYSFRPSAFDSDGDALTFSIQNLPDWASFDRSTGRLFGTPTANNVGRFANIRISVSDGQSTASLPDFSIDVFQASDGRVTLSWSAPTQNTDGTALTNLAGYRIVYGTDPQALTESVKISNPSVNTFVVDNLFAGTWYFAVKAYTTSGKESSDSGLASTDI